MNFNRAPDLGWSPEPMKKVIHLILSFTPPAALAATMAGKVAFYMAAVGRLHFPPRSGPGGTLAKKDLAAAVVSPATNS